MQSIVVDRPRVTRGSILRVQPIGRILQPGDQVRRQRVPDDEAPALVKLPALTRGKAMVETCGVHAHSLTRAKVAPGTLHRPS